MFWYHVNPVLGHKHWVQCIAWAPDATSLASGGRDNEVPMILIVFVLCIHYADPHLESGEWRRGLQATERP